MLYDTALLVDLLDLVRLPRRSDARCDKSMQRLHAIAPMVGAVTGFARDGRQVDDATTKATRDDAMQRWASPTHSHAENPGMIRSDEDVKSSWIAQWRRNGWTISPLIELEQEKQHKGRFRACMMMATVNMGVAMHTAR